ncbi:MAG: bifunctional DNA primase/polymerase [Anaerolineaceae bacterium]|nr:bifunctional DNA primase/polymerase [Anaerolineaceae bacterium]
MREGVKLDTVFWLSRFGFSVIPTHLGAKQPKIRWAKYQKEVPTHDDLIRWFRVPCNGAVVTGTNNLVVIDFDTTEAYLSWMLWAHSGPVAAQLILRDAYKVRTSRGIHVYCRAAEKIRNAHLGDVDVKAWGGLVTIAGSVHPSGVVYREYQQGIFPLFTELKEVLPKEILAKAEAPQEYVRAEWKEREVAADNRSDDEVLDSPVRAGIDLGEIKRRYRIEDFVQIDHWTGEHKAVAKCPFHDDNSPSFWIDTERQLCGCFVCNMLPMDVINLVARLEKISNAEAITYLGGNNG